MDARVNLQRENVRRGFNIHQKVVLEIDFSGTLWGYTEITIVPLSADLKTVHLHSRQCTIHSVNVAGHQAEYTHFDPLANLSLDKDPKDCHRHRELKRKLYTAYSESDEGELSVAIPSAVSVGPNQVLSDSDTPSMQDFSSIVINIAYSLRNPVDGFQFVAPTDSYPYRIPHAFTTPSSPDAARCWVPCVDNLWEKCTWEFEFIVPRFLEERDPMQDDEPADAIQTLVVCSGELVEQVAHPFNSNKTIFLFSQAAQTSVQHIAFAAGPFHLHSIPLDYSTDETSAAGSQQPLMYSFCLPGHESLLSSSTSTLRQAMSYYTSEFGSYPFSSYKLVFVDELPVQRFDSATLSLVTVDMLHGEDALEHAFETRQTLAHALACQWTGINILPKMWSDLWLVNGLSAYITGLFLRKCLGNNEYRFRLKKDMERVAELDTGTMPPICQPTVIDPPGSDILPFINLKAPLVLHILDRRMGKSGTSLGLSRVLPKIFLSAISGEMQNNALSTHSFLRTCRKVSGVDPRIFAEQWIYGSGCPSFAFSASFNRKKMAVEITMRQDCPAFNAAEGSDVTKTLLRPVEFFEGTMTVRIHEADGTPYEHVLDIRSPFKRYEVPFNTKYKRVRRNTKRYLARQAAAQAAAEGDAEAAEAMGMVDMGFGLEIWEKEEERNNWKVADWTEEDENTMSGATYEWIRMDADFEWIGNLYFEQPDFMWVSQLQRDRDVVAQLEAINALARLPSQIVSSTLTKTVLVTNYFFRIRCEAALALVHCAIRKLDFIGLFHLFKLFLRYCYDPEDPAQDLFAHSYVPKPNDFSNLTEYFVRKTLINAIARVRFENGQSPGVVRQFLIDQLRYNDNTANPYSDGFYICTIISATAFASVGTAPPEHGELMPSESRSGISAEDTEILKRTITEIDRYRSMDRLIPSPHNIVTIAALEFYMVLGLANLIPNHPKVFFPLTREGNYTQVRLTAFDGLFLTKWYTPQIASYVLAVMANDPSRVIRRHVARNAVQSLAIQVQMGEFKTNSKDQGSLLIEEDGSRPEKAKEQKRTEMDLMIKALRKDREAGKNEMFRDFIMPIALAPDVDHEVRWCVLKLADILVKPNDEAPPSVKIHIPSTPVNEVPQPLSVTSAKPPRIKVAGPQKPPSVSTNLPPRLKLVSSSQIESAALTPVTPSLALKRASQQNAVGKSPVKARPRQQKTSVSATTNSHHAPKYQTKGMTEQDLRACRNSLKKIKENKNSAIFLQPVDPVRDNAPRYLDIIKEPMDLGTMSSKLESGAYENRGAFRQDFILMINNAKQYNAVGSFPFKAAVSLETSFEKQWSKINHTLEQFKPSINNTTLAESVGKEAPAPAAAPRPTIKLKLGGGGGESSATSTSKPQPKPRPRKIKTVVPSPEDEPSVDAPPPPYIDDGSHDLLQEVIAVENERKKSAVSINGSASKRKAESILEDDDDFLPSAAPSKRRASPPLPPRPQKARMIMPGPMHRASLPETGVSDVVPVSAKGKEREAVTPAPSARSTPPAKSRVAAESQSINKKRCEEVLKALVNDPSSLYFRRPVQPIEDGCPTYFDEIQHPMDLRTMSEKLQNDQYGTMADFQSDFELIIANCRQFNPPTTDPVIMAERLEATTFRTEWRKALEMKLNPSEKKSLQNLLANLKKDKLSGLFLEPVDPARDNLPHYHDIIPKEDARDLRTIGGKLQADRYDSVKAFEDDLELMVQNAMKFNADNKDVLDITRKLQARIKELSKGKRADSKKRKEGQNGNSQPPKRMKIG